MKISLQSSPVSILITILALLFFFMNHAHANFSIIDEQNMQQSLQTIQTRIKSPLNDNDWNTIFEKTNTLHTKAEQCIHYHEIQLKRIQNVLDQTQQLTQKQTDLKNYKAQFLQSMANCTLFSFQAQAIIDTLNYQKSKHTNIFLSKYQAWTALGSEKFTVLLVPKLLLTTLALYIFLLLFRLLKQTYQFFAKPHKKAIIQLHQQWRLKPNKPFFELVSLYIIFNISLFNICLFTLLILWGAPTSLIHSYIENTYHGFNLFDLHIIPAKIFRGFFMFSAILFLGRWLILKIAASPIFQKEQESILTLLSYINFLLASILGLLTAGFQFQGLFFILGAISVGLGFGLNQFVSDLICGLILLINKPIKIGDYILVNDVEGIIKHIHLLSTEIRTPLKTDIIIPNTNLLNQPLINYTHQHVRYKIITKIELKNHEDFERVSQTLLKILKTFPEIIQDDKNKPNIIFQLIHTEQGTHPVLTLEYVIKDIKMKKTTATQVNIAISKAIDAEAVYQPKLI